MESKHCLSKSKSKIPAFTLVETIISLSVSLVAVFLLTGFLENRHKENSFSHRTDHFQVIAAVVGLQSDQLNLQYRKTKDDQVVFYSPDKQMEYSLKITGDRLVMRGKKEGYMPLLFGLDDGKISFREPYLTLDLSLNGVKYHEKISFPPAKNQKQP